MIEKYVFVVVSIELAENVCLALQNRRYCFYLWRHNVFYVRLTDKLTYASYELNNIFVDQGQFSDPDFISGTH